VTLTGYFLKNFTYQGEAVRDGAPADVTMPMFVVLHLENIPHVRSPYRAAIAWICGTLVLFALLFVLVLRRRDRREAARIEAYRSDLKRRRRAVGTPPAPGTGESLAPGDSPPRDPAPGAPG
jgi:hypothetical protein